MNILEELTTVINALGIPVETGVFSDKAPDCYIVILPLSDNFFFADNSPVTDIHEARLSIFSKKNYLPIKKELESALIKADITIIGRQYIGFEPDTGYHHYNIDTAKSYDYLLEED